MFAFVVQAQPERKYIREGNSFYFKAIDDSNRVDTSMMKKAAENYRRAIEKKPSSMEAKFNLSSAEIKVGNYEAAERELKALQNSILHDTVKAKIFHNLGNSQLLQGKVKESIESYKQALRLNPKDLETKYNLAFAQSLLNKMQNQQNQQNQNDQQNQQNQQNQQQSGEKKNAQQQNAEQQQAEEKPMTEDQKQDDRQKYSKEDAERLLEALQNQEQRVQDNVNKQKKSRSRNKPSRDW